MNTKSSTDGQTETEKATERDEARAKTPQPSLVLCELTATGIEGLDSHSPFCLKVHRALRVKGLRYERRHSPNPAAHKRHNPTGQVPVLLVDGVPVCDSTKILARIESMGSVALMPEDPRERAEALLWEELADTALNGFLVASRWADERNWPGVRDAYFGGIPALPRPLVAGALRRNVVKALVARDVWRAGPDACWERYGLLLDSLDARAPDEGFWVGAKLSVADVALFAQLHGLRNGLTAPQRAMIAARARLSRWLNRVDLATRGA